MTARAMDNFGLTKLFLVNPRDVWPNKKAENSAKHAKNIVSTKNVESDLLMPIFSTRSTNGSRRYASTIPATKGIKTELRV